MKSPVSYQGAKQRIAGKIVDALFAEPVEKLYDLCCGSGAITLEVVNRGLLRPDQIVMVDAGPWGSVWQHIGAGTFSLSEFKALLGELPADRGLIKEFMESLAKRPVDPTTVHYVYLLLQAGAFGGKALWHEGGRWMNCGFRSFWQPTATSNRRSPVNPMMPMPDELLRRVEVLCERMRGATGFCADVRSISVDPNATVYIDPPYSGTSGYGFSFDVVAYAKSLNARVAVSEGKAVSENSQQIETATARAKGGISGERVTANAEWLSWFNKETV